MIDFDSTVLVSSQICRFGPPCFHPGNFPLEHCGNTGSGTLQWSYAVGSDATDIIDGVGVSAGGDVYGCGRTKGALPTFTTLGSNEDAVILKLNAAGVQPLGSEESEHFLGFGTIDVELRAALSISDHYSARVHELLNQPFS